MFRSTARNLRIWWADFSEDILGADLPPSVYEEDALDYHLSHPHRQQPAHSRPRREGTVAARPAHCLAPVQRGRPRILEDTAAEDIAA